MNWSFFTPGLLNNQLRKWSSSGFILMLFKIYNFPSTSLLSFSFSSVFLSQRVAFFFFLKILFIYLTDRMSTSRGNGRGGGGGGRSRLPAELEPDMGLRGAQSQDSEIMTWAEGRCLTAIATQSPPVSGGLWFWPLRGSRWGLVSSVSLFSASQIAICSLSLAIALKMVALALHSSLHTSPPMYVLHCLSAPPWLCSVLLGHTLSSFSVGSFSSPIHVFMFPSLVQLSLKAATQPTFLLLTSTYSLLSLYSQSFWP